MEARKWQLRAKQNGFIWGDVRIEYFHRIASAIKKRNTIAKLQIGGVDCFDQALIKEELRKFYINLFSFHNNVSISLDYFHFPLVDGEKREWTERNFTEEEVWGVIKKIGCNKSPGLDGFSTEFFTRAVGIQLKRTS